MARSRAGQGHSPGTPFGIEIGAQVDQVGDLTAEHDIQRAPAREGGVRLADPGIAPGRVGEESAQRLVDPHQDRHARAQVAVDPSDIAGLPPRPRPLRHVAQQDAGFGIRQLPGPEQVDGGACQRCGLLIGDDGKVGAGGDRLDRGELHGFLLWHEYI